MQTTSDPFDEILDRISTKGNIVSSSKKIDERKKFTCEHCGGSGKYRGARVHQMKDNCFPCGGKGYFLASLDKRRKSRVKAAERKRNSLVNNLEIFDATHAGLRTFLEGAATWSSFASSLHQNLMKYGELSEKQTVAALSMRAKMIERQAAKELELQVLAAQQAVIPATLERLAKAFLESSAHLKFPKLRLRTEDGLNVVLSRAGAASRNVGHIYVTDGEGYGENVFYGRITPDGRPIYKNAPASVIITLERFNADPASEIKVQGQRTGQCCCCGRELTDPASIFAGIGPVCAENWGF